MTRVAFFGGSFDPPHFGHVLASAYARGRGFDRVVVAPVRVHAFGKRPEAFAHRLAMARLAFSDVAGVTVSEIEAELPEPNYTLATLQALQAREPGWRLELLIGSDVLAEAHKWHHFDEVRALAPPFVLHRGAAPPGQEPLTLPAVSSTAVRAALACRVPAAPASPWLAERVPARVLEYIEREGLYLPRA